MSPVPPSSKEKNSSKWNISWQGSSDWRFWKQHPHYKSANDAFIHEGRRLTRVMLHSRGWRASCAEKRSDRLREERYKEWLIMAKVMRKKFDEEETVYQMELEERRKTKGLRSRKEKYVGMYKE